MTVPRRARILWRLRRDFDADLMAYRGWSCEELELEYFTLRLRRLLGPDGIKRAVANMAHAIALTGIEMQEAAELFRSVAVSLGKASSR